MTDRTQLQFFVRGYIATGIIAALAAGALVIARLGNLALGLALGALIGLLMIHGTVLLGSSLVSRAEPDAESACSVWRVVAFQVAKYVVGIGALYVLVTMTQTSPAGLALGYGIPLVVIVIMGLGASRPHKRAPKDY